MDEKEKTFEIKDMDLYYGTFQSLKKLSIDIFKHQVTALIGPSGCGKSTFLRSLNRMNDLVENCKIEGTMLFDGQDFYHKDYDVIQLRTKVGMVFQKPNPFPKSIYENLAYGPKLHGIKSREMLEEIAEKTLTEVGLWEEVKDRLNKSAMGLSGGQAQRLCIARCLSVEPEVILMDEPTSALDPIATSKIEALIQDLSKKYTIVIVTHNMQQAGRISDRTAFFLSGEILEIGSTQALFTNPSNPKTEEYITGRFG